MASLSTTRVPVPRNGTSPGVALSIVIPCYRSAAWLDELVARIDAATAPFRGRRELVLVNDASPDDTWSAIRRLCAAHDWVRGIDLYFNAGQFCALLAGLERARGDWIVTMDDDLQTPPEEIPKLVDAAFRHPDTDAIIGSYAQKRHAWHRRVGSRLVARLFERLYGKPDRLQTTSFRILRRELAGVLCAHQTRRPVMAALILQSTHRVRNVPVEHHPRLQGRSGYTLSRLVGHTLDSVFSASTLPLRVISSIGMVAAIASLLLSAFYFLRWLHGDILEPGFTTLVLLLTFLAGLILASIGVVGEYVMRVVTEVTGQPRHAVREEVDGSRCGEVDPERSAAFGYDAGARA